MATPAPPWLSVLMPAYKVEPYIRASIVSVLSQAGEGVEIVVVDDASPDAGRQVVAGLQAEYPGRIRFIAHPRNLGVSAARNTLLDAARGDYAWFVDPDDILLPGAIAELRAIVERDAPDLVLCDFRLFGGRAGPLTRLRGGGRKASFAGRSGGVSSDRDALLVGLLEGRQLHAWSKIARLSCWRAARFPDVRCFEDMAVLPWLVGAVRSWIHVPRAWVGYRQRGDSLLARLTPDTSRDLLASLRGFHDGLLALRGGLSPPARRALEYFGIRSFAALARRMPAGDASLERQCREAIAAMFPQGVDAVLAAYRRRGWWLRAWRAGRSLARRGWLA